jgi:hypothetical protein
MKSEKEICELIDLCNDRLNEGKQSWGSFEDGVKAALEWVQGYGGYPIEDFEDENE